MTGQAGRAPMILDPSAPRSIDWTAERIREGGVVSFPTDTVYALAASLAFPDALERIYDLKGRDEAKPLPVLLSAPARLRDVAAGVDDRLLDLADRFWPGPLTIVLPARDGLPAAATGRDAAGGRTVAVRVPDHFLAIEVIERAGGAVGSTSANRSGDPPARSAAEVLAQLPAGFDILLDGGVAPGGVPSTVVEAGPDGVRVLREGAIARETLEQAWREILAGSGQAG
ncbi:MAG: L-threonylcarbamoyladenylate synthase [Chloroflexota bacterium]